MFVCMYVIALQEFNVLDTQPAEYQPLTADMVTANQTVFWLVSISLFLGVLLILCIMLCLTQRANYVRQLKAATATAYGIYLTKFKKLVISSFKCECCM